MIEALQIRIAEPADIPVIHAFVLGLAEFENLQDHVSADEETLRASLFGPRPAAECLIAETGGAACGFAVFCHNFSTFTGKRGLYLEDIFVLPDARGGGVGLALFRALARIAVERDCGRMEWSVLDWNEKAIGFYRRLGAEPQSEWTVQRLSRALIERLAAGA